jgi:hypothetical protein
MNTLKEFAEMVFGVLCVLGVLYLRLKTFEGRDLLEESQVRTLFDKERKRMKF